MTRLIRTLCLPVLILALSGLRISAEELSVLGGVTAAGDLRATNAWEVDYRQDLYKYFDASVSYINEGHFIDHRRDGTAWEGWTNLPLLKGQLALSFGAGVYYYYDTQPLGAGSVDVHGTAPIFSFAATGYLNDRWFYRFMFNRITPRSDIQTNTAMIGIGYWFGPNQRPRGTHPNAGKIDADYVTEPQLTVFGGQSVVNTLYSEKAWAGAVEYRQGIMPNLDGTLSYIYEHDPRLTRQNGIAMQVWPVNTFFNESTLVGIGVGPYINIDTKHVSNITRTTKAEIAPLVSLTIARQLSDHWIARMVWDRVTSYYNRDSDIFLFGLGYRWR